MSRLDLEFELFVASRSGGLLRLAWLLTGDINDAEDVVQTALARAFQHWKKVSDSDDIDAYGRRIVVNANSSRFRRHRVKEVPLVAAGRAVDGDLTSVDGDLTSVDDRGGLGQALRSLPAQQRKVVALRYIEDVSEQDTAATLGCTRAAVKSAAARGLAALREHPALRDPDAPNRPPPPQLGLHPPGARS